MTNMDTVTDGMIANATAKWGMGGGAVTSIFGALTTNDYMVVIGIITTIAGFIVNLYYQYKRDKRAEEEHQLKLKKLNKDIEDDK